uniref:Uncharacterized protein n=1 Tax=Megaselia scalaris TaxID=36166 RepID=T1GZW2_MEGSC
MMYFLLVLIAALLLPSVEPILVSANSVPLENQSPSSDQYLESLEKSVAGIFQKVAYGTTSTTKRSIPDNYVPTLTTVATLPLTTERFTQSENANQKIRNFGIDRDHALPTSAPNADILKSNSNPSYPNPNRHHNR